ncbi:MAG: bifunctional phosphopantothenoylcysteine decarboxylase/phosphopantothenate--cysteine ligase CoaBC [Nitrospirales bacterium]|nr:MAG: bifunctional phosphopantothenoylcysteine decarboxylase/phosphopantothenate--cysteine ligase CoaBC [Nitrospirales bacterium]
MTNSQLAGKRVVLAVTGSVAAYKAIGLLRLLTQQGATVDVVMTESATRFVAPLTFEVLSGSAVTSDLFSGHQDMRHLSLTEQADVMLVAPCTANTLAKLALGLADNVLGTMALTLQCPMVICPAMDGEMWSHPTVQGHVKTLQSRGAIIVEPENGALASGQWGQGRLAAEETILATVQHVLQPRRDWLGERVLISAGPTREPIDPVRFLSNGSSGKMGFAMAEAAAARGAEVVLVSGPTQLECPKGVTRVPVVTADEMLQALTARFDWATTLIMAAAVGDFRAKESHSHKVKKDQWKGEALPLERTPDILLALSAQRTHQRMIGFAAETDDLIEYGQTKLQNKQLNMLIVNQVGGEHSAFGNDSNEVIVLTPNSSPSPIPRMLKRQLADVLLDRVKTLSVASQSQPSASYPTS